MTTTSLTLTLTPGTGGVGGNTTTYLMAPDVAGSPGTYAALGPAQAGLTFNVTGLSPNTPYHFKATTADIASPTPHTATTADLPVTTTAAGLVAGSISATAVLSTGATYTLANTTGGVVGSGYLVQFKRASITAGVVGSYSNIGPNSTATVYIDSGLSPTTPYSIEATVTDSAGTPATATAITVVTTVATGAGISLPRGTVTGRATVNAAFNEYVVGNLIVPFNIPAAELLQIVFANGTGSSQIDLIHSFDHTLAGSPLDLDLTAIQELSGSNVSMARVRYILAVNNSTVAAQVVAMGRGRPTDSRRSAPACRSRRCTRAIRRTGSPPRRATSAWPTPTQPGRAWAGSLRRRTASSASTPGPRRCRSR